jgi:hypothetical protein
LLAIKAWARSIFVLTVFSGTVLLLVPKSMTKQAKFVVEMLLLLCVVAPLAGLFRGNDRSVLTLGASWKEVSSSVSLERFLASETSRRVLEMGARADIPIDHVEAVPDAGGFTLVAVKIWLKESVPPDTLDPFMATLSAYLGVPRDTVTIIQPDS